MHSKHEGTNMKCKPNCAGRDIKQNQTGELLWRDTGGIHWRILASRSGLIRQDPPAAKDTQQVYSADSTGELLWDTQRDTRRDPLVGCSGGNPLASYSGSGDWRATLGRAAVVGYSAGSTGEQVWRDTGRDPLESCSGGILGGGVV